MITKQPWFGPKRSFGWGWTPISWQGWTATGLYLVTILGGVEYVAVYRKDSVTAMFITVVSTAVYFVVIALTGTKPGGPGLGL
jgi:hypothetical protein